MTEAYQGPTPPPELVEQWYDAIDNSSTSWKQELVTKAARWGADQELEACVEWLPDGWGLRGGLRAARRAKPPSLAEQALLAIDEEQADLALVNYKVIRAALERLRDLEDING